MNEHGAKRALIFGISGQDGTLLARLLLTKGYEVFGASRDAEIQPFANLKTLGIRNQIRVVSVSLLDFRSVLQAITRVHPDEIYNLAGQSSVGLSFDQPAETFGSISVATLNLLEAIRFHDSAIRLYNACSSECFGNTSMPADENTPMRPRSPYAVARLLPSGSPRTIARAMACIARQASSSITNRHSDPSALRCKSRYWRHGASLAAARKNSNLATWL